MRPRIRLILLTLGIVATPACAEPPAPLKVNGQQQERLGISVATARKAEAVGFVDLVGRVVRSPDGVASIVAPFAGSVVRIHATPGALVKAGDPLVTIASRDFSASASSLRQAQAELAAAEAAFARQAQLVDLGLAARSALDEAQARVGRARAQVQEGQSLAAGAQASSGRTGAYVVRATSSGRLSALDARPGQTLEAMMPLASITTSDALWLEIQIPARLTGEIRPGDSVALPSGEAATIMSATDIVDTATRSSRAVASVPVGYSAYEGQLVRVKFSRESASSTLVSIPARAVVQIDGVDHVFRRTTDGFSPIPVQVAGKTVEAATLSGGLHSGDIVAVSGLSELKAMALRGAE